MNKRIEELAEQATKEVWGTNPMNGAPDFEGYELDQEKFAELIIKECANELREAEDEADREYNARDVVERNTFTGYDFAEMLLERFGVE